MRNKLYQSDGKKNHEHYQADGQKVHVFPLKSHSKDLSVILPRKFDIK